MQTAHLSKETIAQFRSWLSDQGRAGLTAKSYCGDLSTFLIRQNLNKVSKEDYEAEVLRYLNSRRQEAPKSTLRRMASFRMFAKWAWEMPILANFTPPKPAMPNAHPLPGGMQDIHAMLSVCRNEDHLALVGLMGFFSLRISEARSIKAIHFDELNMELLVRGKGDKERRLPYASETMATLLIPYQRSLLDGSHMVRLSDSGARLAIQTLAKRAGITAEVSSHDLRATGLTDLYERTRDMRLVAEFAGHASMDTTRIYVRANRHRMREAVNWHDAEAG